MRWPERMGDDGVRVGTGVDGERRNPDKGMLPGRVASRALRRHVRRPELVAKPGGVASEHPAPLPITDACCRARPAAGDRGLRTVQGHAGDSYCGCD